MKLKKGVKQLLIVIITIITIFFGIACYMAYQELKEEEILKQEIINYSNKDFLTDSFKVEVKTTGDRAYIEETIKKYYKELSDNMKEIISYLNNEELTNILSVESITEGRPIYENSHQIINNAKEKVNKSLIEIIKLCNEKTIKNLIDKEKLDDPDYYYEMYLDLMYTKKDLEELKIAKKEIGKTATQVNAFLDKLEEILIFLENNDAFIEYKNGLFHFTTEETLVEFTRLINELDNIGNINIQEEKNYNGTV